MPYRIVVYDSAITRMHQPGGDVHSFTKKKTRRAKEIAIATSPVDTGKMKAAHSYRVRSRTRSVYGYIENSRYYARFVHDGRRAFAAKGGGFLRWETLTGPYAGSWRVKRVDGVTARPWMWRALRASMREPV